MSSVLYSVEDGIAHVVLNDPDHRNALTIAMVDEIGAIFDRIEADENVRAVVLSGAGSAFCAGADVDVLLTGEIATFRRVYDGFLRILRCTLPTIAAVQGAATGAGLNLVLACDVCITTPEARLMSRFLEIGLHPGGGHTWLLERAMGPVWSRAAMLFNEEIDGKTAVVAGLALRCVAEPELMPEAIRMAAAAAKIPRELSIRAKQTMTRMAHTIHHADAVEIEAEAQAWSVTLPYVHDLISRLKSKIARKLAPSKD